MAKIIVTKGDRKCPAVVTNWGFYHELRGKKEKLIKSVRTAVLPLFEPEAGSQ